MLWKLAAERLSAPAALAHLEKMYQSALDTKGLLKVARAFADKDPQNSAAQNNLAALSLLLDQDVAQAARTAADLYAKAPANIVTASTHALALFKQGQAAAGLQVMEKFKPEQLAHPAVAGTYAILLVENGRAADASKYLAVADKAPLLPEEKKLVADAAAKAAKPK